MYMELRDKNGLTEQEFLAQYNPGNYPRPSVTVDMVIFSIDGTPDDNLDLKLLLIRRGGHPYLGNWALPGGFVDPTETVGQAAQRELLEETGVESGSLEQLYTFSDPGRDPRTWVISCAHMALVDSKSLHLCSGDDASDAKWFRLTYELLNDEQTRSNKYQIILNAEDISLTAIVEEQIDHYASEFKIIENNGLAFDHAKIITCAIQRLRSKVE